MGMDRQPWVWRKAGGGWKLDTDHPERRFHAYDVNNNAACEPSMGLGISSEEPNEGSDFCPACVLVVTANPAGRERVIYPDEDGPGAGRDGRR